MTPVLHKTADVEKLNKAMAVVLALQARLGAKSAESLVEQSPDIMSIRFWLTSRYAIVVQFRWQDFNGNGKFDWCPTLHQTPSLVDIVVLLQDGSHVLDPGRFAKVG